jgi:hypothetical protein
MQKHIRLVVIIGLCLLQTGCLIRRAQVANFESGEVLRGRFTDSPFTNGKITITMADGEVLKGRYSAIRGQDSVTFSSAFVTGTADGRSRTTYAGQTDGRVGRVPFSTESNGQIDTTTHVDSSAYATGQSRTIGGTGRAYALISSTKPGSKLMMEVIVSYGVLSGHGWGEARTNDGRKYRVTF